MKCDFKSVSSITKNLAATSFGFAAMLRKEFIIDGVGRLARAFPNSFIESEFRLLVGSKNDKFFNEILSEVSVI